jgi:acyl-CoA thioesterase
MSKQKICDFFEDDRFFKLMGGVVDEAEPDYAVCSAEISAMHLNAKDVVQGGASYTLADTAFAVACNAKYIIEDVPKLAVSQSASISYHRPPKGKRLVATARLVAGGKRISVYQMEVTDELGTKVATMIGNAYSIDL